jgi:hypothetical protein
MRPESGPMRFADDWAGVFLRGDFAGPMGMYLGMMLDMVEKGETPDMLTLMQVRGLAETLSGCDERGALSGLQQMRPFAECVVSVKDEATASAACGEGWHRAGGESSGNACADCGMDFGDTEDE